MSVSTFENKLKNVNSIREYYEPYDNSEKYKVKISNGSKFSCDQTITGLHSKYNENSNNCSYCNHLSKYENTSKNINEFMQEDIVAGANINYQNKKKNNDKRSNHMTNINSNIKTSLLEDSNDLGGLVQPDTYKKYTSRIYNLATDIFNQLKKKNINSTEKLMNHIYELTPKKYNIIESEYNDIYKIIQTLYRDDTEGRTLPLLKLLRDYNNSSVYDFVKTVSNISMKNNIGDFYKRLKYQSNGYTGIDDLEDTIIYIDKVNPMDANLWALAITPYSYMEQVIVLSASDKLVLQIFGKKKILNTDNFALAVSRYSNLDNELEGLSFEELAANELIKIHAHLMFQELVYKVRMGIFIDSSDKNLLLHILSIKTIERNLMFNISEEEYFFRSFFHIFGFNPILIRKPTMNIMNNSLNAFDLKAVPFLTLNADSKIGSIHNPIKLTSDVNLNVSFDPISNRVSIVNNKNSSFIANANINSVLGTFMNPTNNGIYYNQLNTNYSNPIFINGSAIYFVNRAYTDLLSQRLLGEVVDPQKLKINTEEIQYEEDMDVNTIKFKLKTVCCYVLKNNDPIISKTSYVYEQRAFTITNGGEYWFEYNPVFYTLGVNRDTYKDRLLTNYYNLKLTPEDRDNMTKEVFDKTDIAAKLLENFDKGRYSYFTFLYSKDEVSLIIRKTSYFFIYSQNTMDYVQNRDSNDY